MKVWVTIDEAEQRVFAIAISEGEPRAEIFKEIKQGEDFFGITYAELVELGNGTHDIL